MEMNDELLARYLDGAMNTSEKTAFEAALGNSPELLEEYRELKTLETLLERTTTDQIVQAAPFLHGMENTVAGMIAGAGATAAAGTAAAAASQSGALGLSSWVASLPGWMAATAGLIGTAGIAVSAHYVFSTATPETPQPIPAPAQGQEQLLSGSEQQQPSTETQQQSAPITTQETQTTAEQSKEQQPPQSTSRLREYSARVSGTGISKEQYAKIIDDYTQQYTQKEAQADRPGMALLAKTLGTLYRETGNLQNSRLFLQRALTGARSLSIKELEGETLGEMALLELASNNRPKALQLIQECLVILTPLKTSGVSRWEAELKRLQQD